MLTLINGMSAMDDPIADIAKNRGKPGLTAEDEADLRHTIKTLSDMLELDGGERDAVTYLDQIDKVRASMGVAAARVTAFRKRVKRQRGAAPRTR